MLLFMKQLVISSPGTQEEELQAILNYLHTIHEVQNIRFSLEQWITYLFRMKTLSTCWTCVSI